MQPHLFELSNQQKQQWNTFSPGWKKWDNWVMYFLGPMGKEIINLLDIQEDDRVLDLATGTGEPGLSIAEKAKKGSVTGVDISEGMLEVAKENAARRGIKNYKTIVADATELPFEDNTFDAISCRMGFMFFPDMDLAAAELYRVLKPGGRLATCVWGDPEKNYWATAVIGPVMQLMQQSPPPPGAPGLFRCAKPEIMQNTLNGAGFKNINYKEAKNSAEVESIDFYWQYMNDIAAPIVSAMEKADDDMKHRIKDAVYNNLGSRYALTGPVEMENCSLIFYAEK